MASLDYSFAKLTPTDDKARQLVSRAVGYMKNHGDEFHLKFFVSDISVLDDSLEAIDSAFDSQPESEDLEALELGFYQLSFQSEKQPKEPDQGWVVGRGTEMQESARRKRSKPSASVDFLIADPRDSKGRFIAAEHLLFRIHPRSGVLLISRFHDKARIKYQEHGSWYELPFREARVICQKTTQLQLGDCKFELEYTIPDGGESSYFNKLAAHIAHVHGTPKPRLLGFLPNAGCRVFRRHTTMISNQTLAWGSFGWVREGVDIYDGEPLAVKCFQTKDAKLREEVRQEFSIARNVTGKAGLWPALKLWCEHDLPLEKCNIIGQEIFMSSSLAECSFAADVWREESTPFHVQLELFLHPLIGMFCLHGLGYMHRDITRGNLLIVSRNPAKAAVSDFGKAVKITKEPRRDTAIGPKHTLAPEVWDTRGGYTETIDLWAWAYAIADILVGGQGHEPITQVRLRSLRERLSSYGSGDVARRSLVELLLSILQWKKEHRPNVWDAAVHACWTHMRAAPGNDAQAEPSAKRAKLADNKDNEAEAHAYIHNSLFSEESSPDLGEPAGATVSQLNRRERFRRWLNPISHPGEQDDSTSDE